MSNTSLEQALQRQVAILKKKLEQYEWHEVSKGNYPEYQLGVIVYVPEEDHITSGMWDVSRKWILLDDYRKPEGLFPVSHWMYGPDKPKTFKKP